MGWYESSIKEVEADFEAGLIDNEEVGRLYLGES